MIIISKERLYCGDGAMHDVSVVVLIFSIDSQVDPARYMHKYTFYAVGAIPPSNPKKIRAKAHRSQVNSLLLLL